MQRVAEKIFSSVSRALATCGGFAVVAVLLGMSGPARADDAPFQLDRTNWMSFERYKEEPSAWHEEKPSDQAAIETPALTAPVIVPMPIALPVLNRPVNVPAMPGVNQGFEVDVSSTLDGKRSVDSLATNPDGPDGLQPPQENWKDAATEARQSMMQNKNADDEDKGAFSIRFAYLPNPEVTPVFNPPHKKYERPKLQVAQTPVPDKEDKAACAAIDAYKKRQLEAIESDRQTLAALQGAISQLGLQKQLDFMVGANGSLTQPAQNADMDFAVSASAPAKN
jgi:hypothetical protein